MRGAYPGTSAKMLPAFTTRRIDAGQVAIAVALAGNGPPQALPQV